MEVVKAEEPVPRLDAVGLAIGTKLITSKKLKRQLMDDSYNRWDYTGADRLPCLVAHIFYN